jgi:hypothetical protein
MVQKGKRDKKGKESEFGKGDSYKKMSPRLKKRRWRSFEDGKSRKKHRKRSRIEGEWPKRSSCARKCSKKKSKFFEKLILRNN